VIDIVYVMIGGGRGHSPETINLNDYVAGLSDYGSGDRAGASGNLDDLYSRTDPPAAAVLVMARAQSRRLTSNALLYVPSWPSWWRKA
jgi:hypothetical protein